MLYEYGKRRGNVLGRFCFYFNINILYFGGVCLFFVCFVLILFFKKGKQLFHSRLLDLS